VVEVEEEMKEKKEKKKKEEEENEKMLSSRLPAALPSVLKTLT
jgi:hypothetical protein